MGPIRPFPNVQAYEEMLKTQEQLLLAEKLTKLGKIAGEISQKIKEPLAFITKKSDQLKKAIQEHDVAFLLDFQATVPPQLDKINEIVNETLEPFRKRWGSRLACFGMRGGAGLPGRQVGRIVVVAFCRNI